MFVVFELIQRLFGMFGLHVSRRQRGVKIDNALSEQLRLAGPSVKLIIEVGSADGRDAEGYADRCPEATVYAFEPLPDSFAKLNSRTELNPRIKPFNLAMSDSVGTADFKVAALDDASSLLSASKTSAHAHYTREVQRIPVATSTLDAFCAEHQITEIDILKMDTQGAELLILTGASDLLKEQRIRVIYTEVLFAESYEGQAYYHSIATLLEGHGYRLHALYDLVSSRTGELSWGDAIFVRK